MKYLGSDTPRTKNDEVTEAINELKIEPPSPAMPGAFTATDGANSMNANIPAVFDKKIKVKSKRVPQKIDFDAIKLKQIDEIILQQHDDKDFFV